GEGEELAGAPGLHVGHADAVDEVLVVEPAPRIDRPALGHRIGVEMAVEEKRGAAPCALDPADGVEAVVGHRLQLGLEPELLEALDHEAGELALLRSAAVALVADHRGEKVEGLRLVDPGHQARSIHGFRRLRRGKRVARDVAGRWGYLTAAGSGRRSWAPL